VASVKDLEHPNQSLSGTPNCEQKRPNRPSWNVLCNKQQQRSLDHDSSVLPPRNNRRSGFQLRIEQPSIG
jgi:hypothetical protein